MTVWLTRELIVAVHEEQLATHGGAMGVRDPGLLEAVLARPLNHHSYRDPDIGELAAMYAIALVRNHPFVDGNKRVAYVALETFIHLNGASFPVSDAEAVVMTLAMASGELTDAEFISWVRNNLAVDPPDGG